jgi:hypothetical protein
MTGMITRESAPGNDPVVSNERRRPGLSASADEEPLTIIDRLIEQ